MMKNVVESLDHGVETNDEEAFAILTIERELGELIHRTNESFWCCRSQRVHPLAPVSHRYSNYLINLARGQMLDKYRTRFLTKQSIEEIFAHQIRLEIFNELCQCVMKNDEGKFDYKHFAFLVLISG